MTVLKTVYIGFSFLILRKVGSWLLSGGDRVHSLLIVRDFLYRALPFTSNGRIQTRKEFYNDPIDSPYPYPMEPGFLQLEL